MKKTKGNRLIWAVAILLTAGVCIWGANQTSREERTTARFQADRLQLEELAKRVAACGSAVDVQPPKGWQSVQIYHGACTTVEFAFGARGIGSETIYWGVNYVPEDQPVGFQGSRWDCWKERDGGRLYYDPEGDNQCYAKQLDTNWYYYEASF